MLQQISLIIHILTPLWLFFFLSTCVILFLLYKTHYQDTVFFSLSLVSSTLAVTILKEYFKTSRPTDRLIELTSYAFPSGHATGSMFLATTLTLLLSHSLIQKKYKLILAGFFFFLALLVSASRVFLGVHTIPQVLAGICIGITIPLFFHAVQCYFYKLDRE